MKYFVTSRPQDYGHLWGNGITEGTLQTFIQWVKCTDDFQLDTETTMIKDSADAVTDRELLLIQIGSLDKKDRWAIEWTVFSDPAWKFWLEKLFEDETKSFILHNARFDYVVIKQNLNIRVENVHDTFLMSKILNTGLDLKMGYHSLAGCLKRFFNIEIDKDAQTTFTKDILTFKQVMYALDDVLYMYDLFLQLKELLEGWNLWALYNKVEREVVKVYGDMELSPMRFDSVYWGTLVAELTAEDQKTEAELNAFVLSDPKLVTHLKTSKLVLKDSLIQPQDEFVASWGSNVTRREILTKLIPSIVTIDKLTKPEIKKFFKYSTLSKIETTLLSHYLDRRYDIINRYLIMYHKKWVLDKGFFIPANTLSINWASTHHKLYIFQFYYPNLQSTGEKVLAKIFTNPLITKFKSYGKVHKYLTTYGSKFQEKYVTRDNTIAPHNFQQILKTGRVAAGILLQMPGQARFRNGFLPPKDNWVFVDSDYASAEVLLMACAAGEQSFIDAVKDGKDLHMMSASLIFKDKWKTIAEEGCSHLLNGSQCKCKEHNKLRKFSKAITFGLAYGLSYVGLSERLDITRDEAKTLIDEFFKTFANLKVFFDTSKDSGIKDNYIIGMAPTNRIRFFHPPLNEGEKSAIGRQSMNFPIQESNGSILKLALIKLRKEILKNNYPAQIHLPVHDEILSSCHKSFADEWVIIQEKAMADAADLFIEPGLLKTDTQILERWTK